MVPQSQQQQSRAAVPMLARSPCPDGHQQQLFKTAGPEANSHDMQIEAKTPRLPLWLSFQKVTTGARQRSLMVVALVVCALPPIGFVAFVMQLRAH